MAKDDLETVTFRIPKDLKTLVEIAAAADGETATSFLRDALRERLSPRGRTYRHPGLMRIFGTFIAEIEARPTNSNVDVMLLVMAEPGGRKLIYRGSISFDNTNPTFVALWKDGEKSRRPWIILRRDIVAWAQASPEMSLDGVKWCLLEQGWALAPYPA